MKWLKNPLLQFLLIGLLLFALQQVWNKQGQEKINRNEVETEVRTQLKEEGAMDSSYLKSLINARLEREVLARLGGSLENFEQDDRVKDALADLGRKAILSQVVLTDPGDSVLNTFLNNNSLRFIHSKGLYLTMCGYGEDLISAQNAANTLANGESCMEGNKSYPTSKEKIEWRTLVKFLGPDQCDSLFSLQPGWIGVMEHKQNWIAIRIDSVVEERPMNLNEDKHHILDQWRIEAQNDRYEQILDSLSNSWVD